MKRVSVTGWVGAKTKEMNLLDWLNLSPKALRDDIQLELAKTKKEFFEEFPETTEAKKVRVTVEVDVEEL